MVGAEVRYRRSSEELIIKGRGSIQRLDRYSPDRFLAPLPVIGPARLSSLASALRSINRRPVAAGDDWLAELHDQVVEIVDADSIEPGEEHWAHPVHLVLLGDGSFHLEVEYFSAEAPSNAEAELSPAIRALVDYRGARLTKLWSYDNDGWDYYRADIQLPPRSHTVADAYVLGSDLITLCKTLKNGEFSPISTLDVLRAGRADVLVGQYESWWLEAKGSAYNLNDPKSSIEFAQDVARFANAEHGGLLVLGLKTKRDKIGDRITTVSPLGSRPPVARYMKIVDRLVFPPIEGLQAEAVPASSAGGDYLLVIHVPTQPEELKPFLVTGAILGDKIEGAFISIVRRRDEHSIPISAPAIHTTLSTGRALLRRGELPDRGERGAVDVPANDD